MKSKGPEVPMELRITVIKNSAEFKSGEYFTVTQMQSQLAAYGCSSETTRSALDKMHRDHGLVDKDYVQVRSRRSARYRKAKGAVDWLKIGWRKHTNERLGVTPNRLGVMGR